VAPLSLLLLSGFLQAKTRYVDNGSTGCSTPSDIDYDPATRACGSGSDTVYDTLLGGIAATFAGDILEVRAGTYAEELDTTDGDTLNSGTAYDAANVVHIRAYLAETVNWTLECTSCFIIRTVAVSYIIFENFVMDASGGQTIPRTVVTTNNSTHHVRWKGNDMSNAAQDIIQIASSTTTSHHLEFINNTIHTNGFSHCIYDRGTDNLWDGNTIHTCDKVGLQILGGGTDGLSGDNHTVKNNIIHDTGLGTGGGHCLVLADTDNSIAYNNVLYDCDDGGIFLKFMSGTDTGNELYNNTIENTPTGIEIAANSTNAIVKNNVIWNTTIADITDNSASTTLSNNLFANDPLFMSGAGNNFDITSGSPAKDAGFNLAGKFDADDDIDGTSRPQGPAWDIGAYEWVELSNQPSAPTNLRIATISP